jgi:hypothetical protein
VCTEAVAVVRAVGADFFLDRWHVEIVSKRRRNVFPVRYELYPYGSHSKQLTVSLNSINRLGSVAET